MLFAVKNNLFAMQILTAALVIGSFWLKDFLGLTWQLSFSADFGQGLLLGAFLLIVSDGGLHGVFAWLFRTAYLIHYRALVEFFRPQKVQEIVSAGLLAGAEELVFRGLLLEAALERLNLEPWTAISATAVVFGLCHLIPRRALWPFTFWAMWEGFLLGVVYVWSGSLLTCVLLHFAHDACGFALFAWQRKTGWLL